MTTPPPPTPSEASVRRTRRRGEAGYALTLSALLIIPLMAIVSLAVDVGAWYVQGQENQRAADAAALAGVVWLPDVDEATRIARLTAERNGFQHGVNANVDIEVLGRSQLKVKIATESEQYFSSIFMSGFAITRSSVAEFVPPVALGSPRNALGTGNLPVTDPDGTWLAISGRCSVAENGDLRNSLYAGSYTGGAYPPRCGGEANPEYTGSYFYGVTVTTAPGAPIVIEAYDASYDPGGAIDLEFARPSSMTTRYIIRDADGPLFDPAAHAVIDTTDVGDRDGSRTGRWTTIGTIPDPQPGTYLVEVTAFDAGNQDFGSNSFGLRARQGATWSSCSTLGSAPDYRADCVQVHALQDLSVYANIGGGVTDMFLAEIEPTHAGKQLEVRLFDSGEGAETIELIDPNGNPVAFTWETNCAGVAAPTGGCNSGTVTPPAGGAGAGAGAPGGGAPACVAAGSNCPLAQVTELDVSGDGAQKAPNRYSQSKYNDRMLILTVDLPADYATAYSGRTWWRIRYTSGAAVTDRTTWSIRVIGDPVRLVG